MAAGRLARHPAAIRPRGRWPRWLWRVHEHLLPRQERHGAAGRVRSYVLLLGLGAVLVAVAAVIGGGRAAAIGGVAALAAQLGAVALLRPAMRAPQPLFMARWFGGVGLRGPGPRPLLGIPGVAPPPPPPPPPAPRLPR